jgi:hypothetical protein
MTTKIISKESAKIKEKESSIREGISKVRAFMSSNFFMAAEKAVVEPTLQMIEQSFD